MRELNLENYHDLAELAWHEIYGDEMIYPIICVAGSNPFDDRTWKGIVPGILEIIKAFYQTESAGPSVMEGLKGFIPILSTLTKKEISTRVELYQKGPGTV